MVLDWRLFCRVQPRFMVLPGTEGMPEYRDYAFHVRVLAPRPVPWPLVAIPGYGVAVGAAPQSSPRSAPGHAHVPPSSGR
ncbi:hypothetical protein SAZ11_11010 [Streptomyces sp. FXJ1.4098]|nr:hypothetical protein [Streptomyces sp. FXJ1.4098]